MTFQFFTAAARPLDEAGRQAELDRYPSDAFADPDIAAIVAEAQALSGAPIAALSIIDGDRQRLYNARGTHLTETPRATAICAHAILTPDEITTIPDLSADRRFAGNPLVAGEGLRFYTSATVRAESGSPLGALCLIDTRARPPLSHEATAALRSLAARATAILAKHRRSD